MSAVRVTLHPNGPLEVTGPVELARHDGELIESPAPTAYLCRCGRSGNKPFCDGSHARTGWNEDLGESAAQRNLTPLWDHVTRQAGINNL